MKKTEHILKEMEGYMDLLDKAKINVSSSSIGWHIEHSLKVINQITIALERSKPVEYKWKFNKWRLIVLTINKMPRGKVKAPKQVVPEGDITLDVLKKSMEKTILRLDKAKTFDPNSHFLHPYLGILNLKPTLSFLAVHTNHHLKIIKDIAKN